MIIKTEVSLELDRISCGVDSPHLRGKYAEFRFQIRSPSPHYFFKKPKKVGDEDYSVFWGMETVSFFSKALAKDVERVALKIIKANIPKGITEIQKWHFGIRNYTSPIEDRAWSLFYSGVGPKGGDFTQLHCDGIVDLTRDQIHSVTSLLPEEFHQ